MTPLSALLLVFVLAATPWLEVLLVVPAGLLAGLPAVPTVLVAAAGNIATLLPVIYGGHRIRTLWQRKRGQRKRGQRKRGQRQRGQHRRARVAGPDAAARSDRDDAAPPAPGAPEAVATAGAGAHTGRASRVFARYGLPGLAVLGPLLTGVHVAAIVGVAAGAPRRASAVWLSAGVVVWAAISAAATLLGIEALVDPERLPQLLAGT